MISGYELLTVAADGATADLLVWRRYRIKTAGIVEALLDANPHLATIHRTTPFIPPGIQLRMPIDPAILAGSPQPRAHVTLWSENLNL